MKENNRVHQASNGDESHPIINEAEFKNHLSSSRVKQMNNVFSFRLGTSQNTHRTHRKIAA